MPNKEVCLRCVLRYSSSWSVPIGKKEFNRFWKRRKSSSPNSRSYYVCKTQSLQYNKLGFDDSEKGVPKNCPYVLEHLVCAK